MDDPDVSLKSDSSEYVMDGMSGEHTNSYDEADKDDVAHLSEEHDDLQAADERKYDRTYDY